MSEKPKCYVIRDATPVPDSDTSPVWWNHLFGWVDRVLATVFSETDQRAYRLPLGGVWELADGQEAVAANVRDTAVDDTAHAAAAAWERHSGRALPIDEMYELNDILSAFFADKQAKTMKYRIDWSENRGFSCFVEAPDAQSVRNWFDKCSDEELLRISGGIPDTAPVEIDYVERADEQTEGGEPFPVDVTVDAEGNALDEEGMAVMPDEEDTDEDPDDERLYEFIDEVAPSIFGRWYGRDLTGNEQVEVQDLLTKVFRRISKEPATYE